MDRKQPPSFDAPDDQRISPDYLQGEATETIDLNSLFNEDMTESGSYVIGDDIWTTTFGKVLQALPIPVLLIERSCAIVAANQAWKKIAQGYEKIQGNSFARLFPKSSVSQEGEILVDKVFSTRKTASWEALLEIDNHKIWGRFTFRSMRIKDQRLVMVLVEDLSLEKKQLLMAGKHKEELKKRVEERTEELRKKNEELVREISDRKGSEEALKASEERYRRMFEDAPLMYVVTRNVRGAPFISDCNELFLRSVGYTRQEVQGKPLADFYSLESRAELLEHGGYARALAGEFFIGERELLTRDGRIIPTLLYTTTEVDPSGQVTGTRAMFVDIIERKKAEKVAQEHIRFQQIFMDVIPIPVFFKDRDGKYLGCNEAFSKFLGRPKMDILGKSVFDLSPKRLADIYHARDIQLLSRGGVQSYESRVRSADGTEHDVVSYKSAFPEVDGSVGGLIGVMLDITEQKQAEQAMRESEAKFRNLFNNAEVGMFRTKLDGSEILDMNEKFLKIFGRTREEMRSKPSVIHWADPSEREEMFRRLNTDGRVTDFECKMLNKQGEVRMCVTSLRLYREQGILEGSITDITERKLSEIALRAANTYNRNLIDASLDPFVTISAEGKITDVNKATEEVTGYSRNKLIGTDFSDYFTDLEKAKSGYQQVFRDGSVRDYELEIRHKEGRLTPVMYNASLYRDAFGEIAGVFAAARDIRDRKRVEEALQEAGSYNRSLIEASLDPLVTISSEGKITDVNKATELVTGYSRQKLIGTDFADYFIDHQKAREGYQQAFKEGEVKDYELEIRNRDGRLTPVMYNASVYRGCSGEIVGLFAAARDITERRRAEEANLRLAAIVETSDDAIISKTLNGSIVSWNEGAARLYGYRAEEVLGRSISILLPPNRSGDLTDIMTRIGNGEAVRHFETTRRTKDGRIIDVSLTVSPVKNSSGQIVGASTIARDITERKISEELIHIRLNLLEFAASHHLDELLQKTLDESRCIDRQSYRILPPYRTKMKKPFPYRLGQLGQLRNSAKH